MPSVFPTSFEGQSPDEFGRRANRVGLFTVNLETARESQEFSVGGTMLWAITASSVNAEVAIQFQEQTSGLVPYGRGQSIRGVRFSRLYITNTPQPGESITFFYAVEEDGRIEVENPQVDSGEVGVVDPGTFGVLNTPEHITLTADTAEIISASNADKRDVVIQAHPDNAEVITVGDSGISTTRGIVLDPGQSITLAVIDNIYAYSETGEKVIVCEAGV